MIDRSVLQPIQFAPRLVLRSDVVCNSVRPSALLFAHTITVLKGQSPYVDMM